MFTYDTNNLSTEQAFGRSEPLPPRGAAAILWHMANIYSGNNSTVVDPTPRYLFLLFMICFSS